ncbi:MAG: Benzoyl-CoA reductase subunit C [Promethearchaeota archaeon]|nr:MAG: Benzoyl-CoA reductase subunit C [Candidatus Lokiarchaeota archaeon]
MEHLDLLGEFSTYLKEERNKGKKIIAFLSHDNIPEELISAAGFIPLRLIFAGDDELMTASHDFLPPSTCSFVQSCIGLFSLKPNHFDFLDLIDYIVVSNHCVSDICSSEIIAKYYNKKRLNFYVSYTQNENSSAYYKLELKEFKKQLEEISGNTISDSEILAEIKRYNQLKNLMSKVSELNINGSNKLQLYQKALLYGPKVIPELKTFLEKTENNAPNTLKNGKSLMLTGCSIFIGDHLINLIEESGGNIVFFDTWIGYNYYSQKFSEKILNSTNDPLDLFVKRFENNRLGDHSIPNFLDNKVSHIKRIVEDYERENEQKLGVINHVIKFCDHFSLFQTSIKDRLQDLDISILNLERDYARANRGQLSTRIEAYLEMI